MHATQGHGAARSSASDFAWTPPATAPTNVSARESDRRPSNLGGGRSIHLTSDQTSDQRASPDAITPNTLSHVAPPTSVARPTKDGRYTRQRTAMLQRRLCFWPLPIAPLAPSLMRSGGWPWPPLPRHGPASTRKMLVSEHLPAKSTLILVKRSTLPP